MFQGEFGIPDELKEIVRHSSEAELTDFVLAGLKEALRNPSQLSQMMPGIPPQMLVGITGMGLGDAALKPMAKSIAQLLIQEVRHGRKLTEEEVRQSLMQTMMSPDSLDLMSQFLNSTDTFMPPVEEADAPPELKEYLEGAACAASIEEAETNLRQAYDFCMRTDPEGTWTLTVLQPYSDVLLTQEKFPEAESLFKQWLKLGEKLLSPDHPMLSGAYLGLAIVRVTQQKTSDADLLFNRAVALADKGLNDPLQHADILSSAAEFFESQKLSRKADSLFERSFKLMLKAYGDESTAAAEFAVDRAIALLDCDRHNEALEWCERALSIKRAALDSDDFDLLRTLVLLADIHVSARQFDRAEPILLDTIKKLEDAADRENLLYPLDVLADLYEETGREEEARKTREQRKTLDTSDECTDER